MRNRRPEEEVHCRTMRTITIQVMKVETQDKILKSDKLIVIIAKCKSPDIRYSGDPNWPGQIFVLVI